MELSREGGLWGMWFPPLDRLSKGGGGGGVCQTDHRQSSIVTSCSLKSA